MRAFELSPILDASSTTIISTSVPAARALSTARGKSCGRLQVGMMMLTDGMLIILNQAGASATDSLALAKRLLT
jgi:hypothetical protein